MVEKKPAEAAREVVEPHPLQLERRGDGGIWCRKLSPLAGLKSPVGVPAVRTSGCEKRRTRVLTGDYGGVQGVAVVTPMAWPGSSNETATSLSGPRDERRLQGEDKGGGDQISYSF